jgi:polysaccharide biosynthesis protein PslG
MTRKQRRLTMIGGSLAVLAIAAALVLNALRPYPWEIDYSGTTLATAQLKAGNVENGIKQVNSDTTVADAQWRRTDFSRPDKEGHYVYFWVDPQFATFGPKTFEITAVVRRIAPDKVAGTSIDYESSRGYVGSDYRNIPEGDAWQEISWTLPDANFVGAWGWSFRLNGIASPNEFLVKEIKVRRLQ